MTAMSDLGQHRRTVRVLGLLSESVEAYASGDAGTADRLIREAAEVDVMAMSGIQGGILIGSRSGRRGPLQRHVPGLPVGRDDGAGPTQASVPGSLELLDAARNTRRYQPPP